MGMVECECGGDICVCLESDNGMIPCPECYGECYDADGDLYGEDR
jgi:hypothetical protein